MRVAVIIPTTDGPAPILKLTPLAQAPRSVLRTQDDYRPLPPSARYHAFVQPGGPLAERIGLGTGQFELRLGAPVETGRSWELPVALAHWLQVGGHSLDPERPELVIWATGALDNDLRILPQSYHLPTKLERSAALLEGWLERNVPILMLLPEDIQPARPLPQRRMATRRVSDLAGAIRAIGRAMPTDRNRGPTPARQRTGLRPGLLLVGFAGLSATVLLWPHLGPRITATATDPVLTEVPRPASIAIAENGETPPPDTAGLAAPLSVDVPNLEAVEAAASPTPDQEPGTADERSPDEAGSPLLASAAAILPRLILGQAPEGSSCRSVLFGAVAARREDRIALENAYRVSGEGELCAFGFHLPESAAGSVDMTLPAALVQLILPSDRRDRFRLEPGQDRVFRLRAGTPARIEADVALTSSDHGPMQLHLVLEVTAP